MKCFQTNKTWREEIDGMAFSDEANELEVIQIEKQSLIRFIEEIIESEVSDAFDVHIGFTGD